MNTQFLKGISLFESLSEAETRLIASRVTLRQWPDRAIIINEGDASDSLYIILSGKVKIFLVDETGEEIILNFLHEGDYFGEVSLFDEGHRSASVMAMAEASFAILKKPDFVELVASNPELALTIMKGAANRIRLLSTNVRSLAASF